MKKEPRFCKWDNRPIPEEKRIDAIFCSPKCGWKYRNDRNRKKKPVIEITDGRRETNIIIIMDLMSRGIYEIPMKSLEDIRFDFNCYDRYGEFDKENQTTEYILSSVSFTIIGENVIFKNLNNGRTQST